MLEYNSSEEPTGRDINKEHGSTTMEQCGWCKHASGIHRYNYCISGSCSLQKSYGGKVTWDQKCFFAKASKEDISAIIKNHEYQIKSAESSIKSHTGYIETLKGISESAPNRPLLPDDRPHDHFNIDEPVMVHFENEWHQGFVCAGYRHHDGCVSYVLDGRDGTPGCGMSVPIVLLKSEYDFFKENPEEYKIWCGVAYNKSFNGNTIEPAQIN